MVIRNWPYLCALCLFSATLLADYVCAAPLLDGVGRNVPVTTYHGREKDIAAAEKFQAWLEGDRSSEGMLAQLLPHCGSQ
jgi:hypothetical protein